MDPNYFQDAYKPDESMQTMVGLLLLLLSGWLAWAMTMKLLSGIWLAVRWILGAAVSAVQHLAIFLYHTAQALGGVLLVAVIAVGAGAVAEMLAAA